MPDNKRNEPIAVVGSACRFAGDVSSPSKLWEVLRDPTALSKEIPDSRFSSKGFYHPDGSYHGHSNVTRAYLLNEDLSVFDAEFFGVKPIEARAMDPQQRFLMEVVYEGLECRFAFLGFFCFALLLAKNFLSSSRSLSVREKCRFYLDSGFSKFGLFSCRYGHRRSQRQ